MSGNYPFYCIPTAPQAQGSVPATTCQILGGQEGCSPQSSTQHAWLPAQVLGGKKPLPMAYSFPEFLPSLPAVTLLLLL